MTNSSVIPFLRDFGVLNDHAGDSDAHGVVASAETSLDIDQASLDAAFQRGLNEGRAEAAGAVDDALAEAEAKFKAQLEVERSNWVEHESAVISKMIADEFVALKDELSSAIARVLKPVLLDAAHARAVAAFSDAVVELASGTSTRVVVTGSPDLLAGLENSLDGRVEVSAVPGDVSELTVTLDDTRLSTNLGQWVSAIEGTAV